MTFFPGLTSLITQVLGQSGGNRPDAVREPLHMALNIEFGATIAQQPAHRPTHQAHQVLHQLHLQLRRNVIVESLDFVPPVVDPEHITGDDPGQCDGRRVRAGGLI